MTRRNKTLHSFAATGITLTVATLLVTCLGAGGGILFGMSTFHGCLIVLGCAGLLLAVWAVQSLTDSARDLGREIRHTLEGMEAFWAESEMEPLEDWQEWTAESDRRPFSRDRIGEFPCPCGSGKPYSGCCGSKG